MRRIVLALLLAGSTAAAADPTPVRRQHPDPPLALRAEAGQAVAADHIVERWPVLARAVAEPLGLERPAPVEIVVLSGETFRRWARDLIPEWGVGFANWPAGPITLDLDAVLRGRKPLDTVLLHEISHVYLGQRLGGRRPPAWFVEGVAQAQSGEWRFVDTVSLVQAASTGRLPRLSELSRAFPQGGGAAELAYRVSLQAMGEIERRAPGKGGWPRIVARMAETGSFELAFEEVVGLRPVEFEQALAARMGLRYGWIAALAGAGTLFTAMTVLFLLGALRAQLRKRRRLAEMEREEARSEAPADPVV